VLPLSPDAEVRVYFEGVTKTMSPAIRHVVLEDIGNLLEGKRGEFLEYRRDIGDHFLEVCADFRVLLACPMRGR